MRELPRFWAQHQDTVDVPGEGERVVRQWGWSADSLAEATRMAGDRVARLAEALRFSRPWDEYYPRTPAREEVLTELPGADGSLHGVVTRNRQGAQVLNTDALLIADLDLPRRPKVRSSWVGRLFGRGPQPSPDPDETLIRTRVGDLIERHPDWGARLYRTAAGFRLLVTGSGAQPEGPLASEVLAELGSDELYARLCASHRTYRARLTPKPWRMAGMRSLPVRWPPADAQRERRYREWVERYDRAAEAYATCRLEEQYGGTHRTEAEELLIRLHDRVTRAESGLPLA